ncbi:MAG: hypothetical protein WC548_01040 [Candidatus Pacearchaeota archaeon]
MKANSRISQNLGKRKKQEWRVFGVSQTISGLNEIPKKRILVLNYEFETSGVKG